MLPESWTFDHAQMTVHIPSTTQLFVRIRLSAEFPIRPGRSGFNSRIEHRAGRKAAQDFTVKANVRRSVQFQRRSTTLRTLVAAR